MTQESRPQIEETQLAVSRSRVGLWFILLIVAAFVLARFRILLETQFSPVLLLILTGSALALAANFLAQILGITRSTPIIIMLIVASLTMAAAEHFFSWQRFCVAENERFYAELIKKPGAMAIAKDADWGPQTPPFLEFMQRGENRILQWCKWIGFAIVELIVAVGVFCILPKSMNGPARLNNVSANNSQQ